MNADGGPAFPVPDTYHQGGQIEYGATGMSLRDWFAGKALEGLMAGYQSGPMGIEACAQTAIDAADAMLRARERGQELEGDEAWFARQAKVCIHRDGDGMSWASCEPGERRIIGAGGSTRAAAIRALRAKVEGGGQ